MLKTRVMTALVMLAVLLVATFWSSPFQFAGFVSAILLVGVYEWAGLMGLESRSARLRYLFVFCLAMGVIALVCGIVQHAVTLLRPAVMGVSGIGVIFWLYAFFLIRHFPENQATWSGKTQTALMGFATLLPTWIALIQLKYLAPSGYLVLVLIALVSIVDIGAYFTGRAWGKAKLAPRLSPGKSWAGFWGGLASCLLLALILLVSFSAQLGTLTAVDILISLSAIMVVAVFSVLGDLFESMLKRSRGVKDSGTSLPGHGGILDRIDSLTAAAPVFMVSFMILFKDVSWQ